MQEKLLGFINGEILRDSVGRVGPNDELLLDGWLDSMSVFNLVDYIESELGFAVPAQDVIVQNFRTVSVIADYLQTKLAV